MYADAVDGGKIVSTKIVIVQLIFLDFVFSHIIFSINTIGRLVLSHPNLASNCIAFGHITTEKPVSPR